MTAENLTYLLVSEYAGEQGHIGGGDRKVHGAFTSYAKAVDTAHQMMSNHTLDFRSWRIKVVKLET